MAHSTEAPPLRPSHGFAAAAWLFLAYLLFVIVYGAWVRITHSGAGCGSHWPLCDGEFVPFAPSQEKAIEFTHRVTSGLSGVFALVLLVWARRRFRGTRVWWATLVAFAFLLLEAALGAGLVLAGLTTDDDSVARAVVIALHLVNTLALMAAGALAAWWAGGGPAPRWRDRGAVRWALVAGLGALVLTSMEGAVMALGDTLFPVDPTQGGGLLAHVREDVTAGTHFLVRLRVVHPVVAVVAALYLVRLAAFVRARSPEAPVHRWAWGVTGLTAVELGAGALNVALAAPGWLQLAHLALAHALWIATLGLTVSALADPATRRVAAPAGRLAAEPT